MPILANCKHCFTPCQIAEKHLGVPVRCHKCGKTFTVHPTVLSSSEFGSVGFCRRFHKAAKKAGSAEWFISSGFNVRRPSAWAARSSR